MSDEKQESDCWTAIRNDARLDRARRVLSLHELRLIIAHAQEPAAMALRRLTFAARTSGGVAGRDEELCAACDLAETFLPHRCRLEPYS